MADIENIAINASAGRHYYFAFGLTIASPIYLPERAAARCAPVEVADVTIQLEPVAPPNGCLPMPGGTFHADELQVLLQVANVARYRVCGGRTICIDPEPGASEPAIRLFLLGPAFAALCHQRGLLPLHASAIVMNGRAVAFAGRTGIGKSTLAAHFQSRGYDVLCDDVCLVSFGEDGRPLAWPGQPRLNLWRDAADTFGHDSRTLERVIDGRDKYHVPFVDSATSGPLPLARVYVLSDLAADDEAGIARLTGPTAVKAIRANTYRRMYLRARRLSNSNFLQAASLARRALIFAAPRRRGYDVFEDEAARLQRHFMHRDVDGMRDERASRLQTGAPSS